MQPATLAMIVEGRAPKGDVLATARIAGIMAAKRTHELIPLCHPLNLSKVTVDLKTFETTLATTEQLAPRVPAGRIVIGESGIFTPADIARLKRVGVETYLVGESLMRQADVTAATRTLLAPENA